MATNAELALLAVERHRDGCTTCAAWFKGRLAVLIAWFVQGGRAPARAMPPCNEGAAVYGALLSEIRAMEGDDRCTKSVN